MILPITTDDPMMIYVLNVHGRLKFHTYHDRCISVKKKKAKTIDRETEEQNGMLLKSYAVILREANTFNCISNGRGRNPLSQIIIFHIL